VCSARDSIGLIRSINLPLLNLLDRLLKIQKLGEKKKRQKKTEYYHYYWGRGYSLLFLVPFGNEGT